MHTADIHLGYQQYNSRQRFDDFGRAFLNVVDQAKGRGVDFVLLAGDLFEKRTVDPLAMRQAVEGLRILQEARIPAIAVEGNHERAHYRDQYSWLEFLDAIGLITLLDSPIQEGRLLLEPYSPEQGGAYVDLPGGVRVYGVKYYGASTDRVLGLLGEALEAAPGPRPAYSILLLHAGLEGILPRCSGAVSRPVLEPLREWISYVALGHVHKPYEVDGWIYNPGSLETWAMDEWEWTERGYYLVDLAAPRPWPGHDAPAPWSGYDHHAELIPTPRRRFIRLRVPVTTCPSPQSVYDAVQAELDRARRTSTSGSPVFELTLEGALAFDRLELDLGHVEGLARAALEPLLVRVQNATAPAEFEIKLRQSATRTELEYQVLRELIERDGRYRPSSDGWVDVALNLKRMAFDGTSPQAILEFLRHKRGELAAQDG